MIGTGSPWLFWKIAEPGRRDICAEGKVAGAVLDINAIAKRAPRPNYPAASEGFVAQVAALERPGFITPPNVVNGIRAAREIVDSFGEDIEFSVVRSEVEKSLRDNDVAFQIGAVFGDILVPITEEWGWVALENRSALLATYQDKSSQPPISMVEASRLNELRSKGMVETDIELVGDSAIEILSPVGAANKAYELQQILSLGSTELERSKLLARNLHVVDPLPLAVGAKVLGTLNAFGGSAAPMAATRAAVITQPHKAWQQVNTGNSSAFPAQLKDLLLGQGFASVQMYVDTAVTVDLLADLVATADMKQMSLWYHQGHGSVSKIYATAQYPGPYVTDQFIRNRANFPSTSIYVYACATLYDDTLAQAFLDRGAASYCGWTWFCKASASVVDGFDAAYWGEMLSGQTVSAAVATVHEKGLCPYNLLQGTADFQLRGNGATLV